MPDKFWASVEPYCRPITGDDINYLKDLIRTREEERVSDLYNIPPLGKHYTIRWAEEDGVEQPKKPSNLGYALLKVKTYEIIDFFEGELLDL